MKAATVLSNLRSRGAKLTVDGDNLRYRWPRGSVSPYELWQLRIHKREITILIKEEFLAEEQAAVLVSSRRFGREIWIALSDETAAELLIEEQQREFPRPVLRQADVKRLDGMPEDLVRAVLNVAAVFPGAGIIQ